MAPRHQGIQRVEWDWCDRCGFEFPVTSLVLQKGLKVCTLYCYDKTLVEERPQIIAAVLEDDSETVDDERLIESDDEVRFS